MKASKSSMDSEFKVEITRQSHHVMPEMHYHDFYEIYIQDQGMRDSIVSNTFYKLSPHDVLLLKPHILHQSTSSEPYTRTVVYFTEKFLREFFSETAVFQLLSVFGETWLTLSSERYYRAGALIREMGRVDRYQPGPAAYVWLAELLLILSESIKERPPVSPASGMPGPVCVGTGQVHPLISYIHENFLTLTNIDEIAATFYVTPSHLCRTFKKLTGYTIIQYINMLKLQKACGLLHDTRKSVTEIALDCGFNSTMYFCKLFHSILGITPTQYRKM